MNRPPVDPKRSGVQAHSVVFTDEELDFGYTDPGGIEVQSGNHIINSCPGCGYICGMKVGHPKPPDSPSWDIVGGSLTDVTTLTLSPSINCVNCCGWHGYLKNGIFNC